MPAPPVQNLLADKHVDVRTGGDILLKHLGRAGRSLLWTTVSVAVFVALALALGLGLGFGLRKDPSHSSSPAPITEEDKPSGTFNTTQIPTATPGWRLPQDAYHLSMDWDINAAPTTRVFNFTVGEIQAAPDGVLRTMIVINGQFPSPMIRANRGDRLLINVTNALTYPTSIHWHGLYQNGTNWMDGTAGITQCPIPPDRSFLYNFTVDNQYGTYWYHSHLSTQYIDGMVGPLIIHAPEEASARKGYDVDQVVLLQDWYHDLSKDLIPGYLAPGNDNQEPVPDNALIQGTNTFNCSSYGENSNRTCEANTTTATFDVAEGLRYRFRVINVGAFAAFKFSVDNHTLQVIEADATPVDPLEVDNLSIHIAQRYSVVLSASQPVANYFIRATMITDCFAVSNPVLNPSAVAILSYNNTVTSPSSNSVDCAEVPSHKCRHLNQTLLVPSKIRDAPPADVLFYFAVSFQNGASALNRGFFNSTTWRPPHIPSLNQAIYGLKNESQAVSLLTEGTSSSFSANQLVVGVPKRQVIDLLIQNFDDGAHPFHLHGYDFWILAHSDPPLTTGYFPWETYHDLNTTNPMRRDTVVVPAFGWALLRFEADHAGLWAFHCHIVWHMEAGLLMQFMTRTDLLMETTLPEDVAGLCVV